MGFIIRVKVEYEHNGARLRAQEALNGSFLYSFSQHKW